MLEARVRGENYLDSYQRVREGDYGLENKEGIPCKSLQEQKKEAKSDPLKVKHHVQVVLGLQSTDLIGAR